MNNWAERQRTTNALVRECLLWIGKDRISADQIYGLCKLTWITNGYDDNNPAYITSTKIPALAMVFEDDFEGLDLDDVASKIMQMTKNKELVSLVRAKTGFTNFYKAYRNSSLTWIKQNQVSLKSIVQAAIDLSSDSDARQLISEVSSFPRIPRGNSSGGETTPERLITPLLFSLDPRLRMPLINGNAGVQNLLKKMKMTKAPLPEQFDCLVKLIGTNGIKDAADLDQFGHDLSDYVSLNGNPPKKKRLSTKITDGRDLSIKDENDIEQIGETISVNAKRIHNRMTNLLLEKLHDFKLSEGNSSAALFDVMVSRYDGENDLLIEVKSSADRACVRMAIGQLYDYWFNINGTKDPHLAVLLPEKPGNDLIALLKHLDIGLLWYENNSLRSFDNWLQEIIS